MEFKFRGNVIIHYRLKTLTGLHIGGSKDSFEIGGVDNPVIKLARLSDNSNEYLTIKSAFGGKINVLPEQPYIPGSSLKGKMRSLLELKYNDVDFDSSSKSFGEPAFGNPLIKKLFGAPADKDFNEPVRIRVFDAYPVEKVETELKFENSINRITSKANPRNFERVPAGAEFEGKIVIRIFSEKDSELLRLLYEGFSLLEDDYLGGGGSRGSGRVKFEKVKVVFRSKEYYENRKEEVILSEGETDALLKASDELAKNLQ
ncbi:type III-A CRISPR-associated RAMP protein Csm3 [Desulfurobacterium sp.]|uniref:type III-A CRISPR-associated RAMP protein Csm3 n=1 Tax=Desulfurobacterium sp. TaxID=2004706 RepID=UPI00262678A6|nr:type III-A CRISPR-associated RAMP protein Csm3 [Desulfurobacterium sp.]